MQLDEGVLQLPGGVLVHFLGVFRCNAYTFAAKRNPIQLVLAIGAIVKINRRIQSAGYSCRMQIHFEKFSATLTASGIVVSHSNGATVTIPMRRFEAWALRQFRADFFLSGKAPGDNKEEKK